MITRIIERQIFNRLFKGKAIIIFGPRQSGKTTLINSIIAKRKEKCLLLNADEPDIRDVLFNATSSRLRKFFGDNKIVIIDEAQRVNDIGLTLKIITDNIKEIQLIATGSSSFELSNKTQEHLTGRKYEFLLLPLSFEEMVKHHSILEEKRLIEHRLIYGYYPEIVTKAGEEKELLKLLATSYIYKDVLYLEQLSKPALLEKILKALAFQLGNEVSFYELAQLIGADKGTIEKYIDILEKAYVIFKLPAFNRNLRNEIKKSKKFYFYDLGLRNAIINNFNSIQNRNDIGALWENFLISERYKYLNYNKIDASIYFWRTPQHQEIDFIEEREGKLFAFEFKWNPKAKYHIPKTFKTNYPESTFKMISRDNFENFIS